MKPLISIIIPIYNTAKYLEKCLNSALNQTLTNIEILCVDDCSIDNSWQILQTIAKKDDRIKIFQLPIHSGVSSARNLALEKMQSDYIMFLDSDDSYQPTICEKLLKALQDEDNDIAVCGVNIEVDENMNGNNRGYTNDKDYATIKTAWIWNKIFKRSILDKYKINFPVGLLGQDAFFKNSYHIMSNGKVGIIKEKLNNYLIRIDSNMSAVDTPDNELMFDAFKIGELTYNFFKEHDKLKYAYQHYFYSMNFGIQKFSEKYYNKIADVVVKSLKTKPDITLTNDCFIADATEYTIKKEVFNVIMIARH
ncbi:MAG: glycosyltransferase family 2 protein [Rickettsiales bacterium]|nr:MAG: glycosyltransferase family 2 protein [Rickettsiales bacterium]